HDQVVVAGVRELARGRRLDVAQAAGAELAHLPFHLEPRRALVDEVELVLDVVVVLETLEPGRHHDRVDAERVDAERPPDLPEAGGPRRAPQPPRARAPRRGLAASEKNADTAAAVASNAPQRTLCPPATVVTCRPSPSAPRSSSICRGATTLTSPPTTRSTGARRRPAAGGATASSPRIAPAAPRVYPPR